MIPLRHVPIGPPSDALRHPVTPGPLPGLLPAQQDLGSPVPAIVAEVAGREHAQVRQTRRAEGPVRQLQQVQRQVVDPVGLNGGGEAAARVRRVWADGGERLWGDELSGSAVRSSR